LRYDPSHISGYRNPKGEGSDAIPGNGHGGRDAVPRIAADGIQPGSGACDNFAALEIAAAAPI
jgi:hypothetical protein